MSTHVFISHSSRDNSFVDELAAGLRGAGLKVWLDNQQLPDGARWVREIQQAVESCGAFVVVMSRAARESEWVERETLLALQLRKPLFIAQIDDVPLPLHLVNRQSTSFRSPDQKARMSLLAQTIREALLTAGGQQETLPLLPPVLADPTEDNFFHYLAQFPAGDHLALIARDLYYWARREADSVIFGGRHTPGYHARLALGPDDVIVFSLWAFMRRPAVQVPFQYLRQFPPYTDADMRRSTLRSLQRLMPEGESFDEESSDRRPGLPLITALNTAEKLETFKRIVLEMVENLRSG